MRIALLVVDPCETARGRWVMVSRREVAFRKTCYEIFAKHLAIPFIDTINKTPHEVMRTIIGLLRPGLEKV